MIENHTWMRQVASLGGPYILVIAYHVLTRREPYRYLGPNYFDEHAGQRVEVCLVQCLRHLGYEVELKPIATAA